MPNNILSAISSIASFGNNNLSNYASNYLIRVNAVGEQLEFFVKDAIAGSFKLKQAKKEEKYSEVFSYLGNQNNPPDIIIKSGDAIEVKKIDGVRASDLALNSSYPKAKLHQDSPMITSACKTCEEWVEKDIVYAVGHVQDHDLKILSLVYGDCYAASKEIYERIKNKISDRIKEMDLEFSETNELGRVNRVDPLGITNLRIRGMWTIQNPLKVYDEFCKIEDKEKFHLFSLMRKEKYIAFPKEDREAIEKNADIEVKDIKIKNPDNPAKLIEAKLISYKEK